MEHRRLAEGLEPGVIGMGTWKTFDVPLEDDEAMRVRREVVEVALEHGVNFFDSSPMYGRAEKVLADTLGDRREGVMVATKVWSRSVERGREQIAQALEWYGGRVDVYQVHNLVEWRAYLPLLRELQTEGKVRAVGITHYAHESFGEMMSIMEREGVQTVQVPYDATDQAIEADLLPLAQELGIGVIVLSPLGGGSLVRTSPPARELEPLRLFGVETWAQALLKWVVSDPRVTVAIPATSRPERMEENARAGDPPFFGPDERERVSWLARRLMRE